MKTKLFLSSIFLLSILLINAQPKTNSFIYIGGDAPAFKAISTKGEINFPYDYFNKWRIIFSHPADFTPVCTSEIMALSDKQENFKKLNTALIVISTDGLNSHIEWIKSMEGITRVDKPQVKIDFPLIADVNLEVSKKYNLLHVDTINRHDVRSVVIIDTENKIRAIFIYPDFVGRNIDEIERTVIALQNADKNNVLIPANWKPGDYVLLPAPKSVEESERLKASNKEGLFSLDWYLWYKKQ